MPDLALVGEILIKREEHSTDATISQQLVSRGYTPEAIKDAIDRIDNGFIFTIGTIPVMTPVAPIIYRFGIRRIEKETNIMWGLIRDTKDIGVKMIDKVQVEKRIVDASVTIVHANQEEVEIDKITRSDAEKIRTLYAYVIEAQRKSVINISQD